MYIYITYDRYENDEYFVLYNVETNERKAIKQCKEKDLIDFIAMCPDNCHSFQLQKVDVTRQVYLDLCNALNGTNTITEESLNEILKNIFNEHLYKVVETIVSTNGCDDVNKIIENYCKKHKLDSECGADYDKAFNSLTNDEELFRKMIKQHIAKHYKITTGPINVYITYDRYEHDEWHCIYHIDTDEDSARQHFIDKDLLDFISYGPDDCHSFQLQRLRMTKAAYRWLLAAHASEKEDKDLENFLTELYQGEYGDDILMSTDGCSDNFEILEYYYKKLGLDEDDDEGRQNAQDKLFDNEELYNEIAREYIADNYC